MCYTLVPGAFSAIVSSPAPLAIPRRSARLPAIVSRAAVRRRPLALVSLTNTQLRFRDRLVGHGGKGLAFGRTDIAKMVFSAHAQIVELLPSHIFVSITSMVTPRRLQTRDELASGVAAENPRVAIAINHSQGRGNRVTKLHINYNL